MFSRFVLSAFLLGSIVSGCTIIDVKKVELSKPYAVVPESVAPSPFRMSHIKIEIPLGEKLAANSARDFGIFCQKPFDYFPRKRLMGAFEQGDMRRGFYHVMSGLGYDVSGDPDIEFDVDDDLLRSQYTIAAKVVGVKADVCKKSSLYYDLDRGYQGEAYMNVRWSVYDRLRRVTVYKGESEGYYKARFPVHDGLEVILIEAFKAAAHNFGAKEDFYKLMVEGKVPAKKDRPKHASYQPKFDPQGSVEIPKFFLQAQGIFNAELLQQNTVLIEAGIGHGSGFFITYLGHILTNAHVVGDATKVRVVTHGGKHKWIAEVMRRDKGRDVALLRVLDMPPEYLPHLRRIRSGWPKIGEDVFAVGTPKRSKDLQGTVTKGIVSAHRRNSRLDNKSYIQSDVVVYGGSSGGPLFDGRGDIVGIAVSKFNFEGIDVASGVNQFIPIGQALDVLRIE